MEPTSTPTALRGNLATGLLALVVWVGLALFGAFVLAHYASAIASTEASVRWNSILPRIYTESAAGNAGIGLHFLAGGVLLLLGGVQFLGGLRMRVPALHRAFGRVYVCTALLTAVGGLLFIAATGTVGGTTMDVGFALYGVLMAVAAVKALLAARSRQFVVHQQWAIRLFALVVGSWLYRMEYALWFVFAEGAGHHPDFQGPFDQVMAFAFYLPNLAVAECVIRAGPPPAGSRPWRAVGLAVLATALAFGTYQFATQLWMPGIVLAVVGE